MYINAMFGPSAALVAMIKFAMYVVYHSGTDVSRL